MARPSGAPIAAEAATDDESAGRADGATSLLADDGTGLDFLSDDGKLEGEADAAAEG